MAKEPIDKKDCPKCGKKMKFVRGSDASFVAPGGLSQFVPDRWECECGYSEAIPS
jgi:hypothetical protein